MVTVIRHYQRGDRFAQVVTVLEASGLSVYYQLYDVMANGQTSLIKDYEWSSEAGGIEYFNNECMMAKVRGSL